MNMFGLMDSILKRKKMPETPELSAEEFASIRGTAVKLLGEFFRDSKPGNALDEEVEEQLKKEYETKPPGWWNLNGVQTRGVFKKYATDPYFKAEVDAEVKRLKDNVA